MSPVTLSQGAAQGQSMVKRFPIEQLDSGHMVKRIRRDHVNEQRTAQEHVGLAIEMNESRESEALAVELQDMIKDHEKAVKRLDAILKDLYAHPSRRGKTPGQIERGTRSDQTTSDSSPASISSAQSLDDERLEWARQDLLRSVGRERSPLRSPFHELSVFHDKFAKQSNKSSLSRHVYRSACCSKTKEFDSSEDLKRRSSENQSFYRPRSMSSRYNDGAARYGEPSRLRSYLWSCASFVESKAIFIRKSPGIDVCELCNEEFNNLVDADACFKHIDHAHKIRQCDLTRNYRQTVHFRQHLENYHAVTAGGWVERLNFACKKEEQTTESETGSAMAPADLLELIAGLSQRSLSYSGPARWPSERATASSCQDEVSFSSPFKAMPSETSVMKPGVVCSSSAEDGNRALQTSRGCQQRLSGEGKRNSLAPCVRCQATQQPEVCTGHESNRPIYPTETSSVMAQDISAANQQETHSQPCTSLLPASATVSPSSFVCQTCHQSFARRTILTNHERTHTGEKPFTCNIPDCGQRFAQQGDKTRHEQTHHSEKAFVCKGTIATGASWGCGRAFRRKDNLLEHHQKTVKGRRCAAQRDKIVLL